MQVRDPKLSTRMQAQTNLFQIAIPTKNNTLCQNTDLPIEQRVENNELKIEKLKAKIAFDLGRRLGRVERDIEIFKLQQFVLLQNAQQVQLTHQQAWRTTRENAIAIAELISKKIKSVAEAIKLYRDTNSEVLAYKAWVVNNSWQKYRHRGSGIESIANYIFVQCDQITPIFSFGPDRLKDPYIKICPQPILKAITPLENLDIEEDALEMYGDKIQKMEEIIAQIKKDNHRLEVWMTGLQQDFEKTKEICRKEFMSSVQEVIRCYKGIQFTIGMNTSMTKRQLLDPERECLWGGAPLVEGCLEGYKHGALLLSPIIPEIEKLASGVYAPSTK